MSLKARTVLNLIAGAVGGLLAWIVIDLTGWFSSIFVNNAQIVSGDPRWWMQILLGCIVGGFVGFLLGLVDALGVDSTFQRLRGSALHTLLGFIGGGFGIWAGQTAFALLAPRSGSIGFNAPADFIQSLIARAIGWALIGAGVGVAQGIARRSAKLVKQGLFGGFAGGLIGGVLFQSAATIVNNADIARLVGFVSIGATTGCFIGLVQTLFKQAWIRVVLGRNEGKEYLVDKPVTVIGRSELADIGLFGNPRIMPEHCAIEYAAGRYRLRVLSDVSKGQRSVPAADVAVNGLIVHPDVWLADGDSISLDDRTLLFRERLTKIGDQLKPAVVPTVPSKEISPKITIIEGEFVGASFRLDTPSVLIGRTDDCGIPIVSDTLVSRKHATVSKDGNRWTITDLSSGNGTLVNNQRLVASVAVPLHPGDHIRVGSTILVFDE